MTTSVVVTRSRYAILALVTSAQAGASIVQQGLGALGPFIAPAFHLSAAQLGVIFGALVGGAAASTALAGLAVDAFGERKMILFSGIAIAFAVFMAAAVRSYPWLVFWMAVSGVGYAASTPAGGRAILLWFVRDRGLAMGIRQMGVPLGGIVGSLLMPAIATVANYQWALVAAGLLTLVPAFATYVWYREPAGASVEARTLGELLASMREVSRDPRLIYTTLTTMVLICGQSNMLTFLALTLVRDARFAIGVAAAALAVAQAGASSGRILWGVVSDRFFGGDRTLPLMVITIVQSGATFALARLGVGDVPLAMIVAFVLGLTAAGWNGLFATALSEIGGAKRAGSALGLGLTGLFATGTLAPPLFGLLADAHGYAIAWTALGAFTLLALIPAFLARRADAAFARTHAA